MSPERSTRPSPEKLPALDSKFLSSIFENTTFQTRVLHGAKRARTLFAESSFGVYVEVENKNNLLVSKMEYGDFFEVRKYQEPKSENLLWHVGDFHYHPSKESTPSFQDVELFLKSRKDEGYRSFGHPSLVSGIFCFDNVVTSKNKSFKALFFGVGQKGPTGTEYQGYNPGNNPLLYKEAMKKSGFWIVETKFVIKSNTLVWDMDIASVVANEIEKAK